MSQLGPMVFNRTKPGFGKGAEVKSISQSLNRWFNGNTDVYEQKQTLGAGFTERRIRRTDGEIQNDHKHLWSRWRNEGVLQW